MIFKLENPARAAALFADWEETIIWSCLQGIMGEIYVDDVDRPTSAKAVLGDFAFFAGKPSEELVLREVKEETGLTLTSYRLCGVITFISDEWGSEYMFLYTADGYEGQLREDKMKDCEEGVLTWVPKAEIENLNLWEGDKIFFRLMEAEESFFSLKLRYKGEQLVESNCEFPINF